MHVPFTRDLPSPLVDCGVIINAKEDLIIFLLNNTLYVGSLASRRRAVSVIHTSDQAFAELHPCQRAVDGSF